VNSLVNSAAYLASDRSKHLGKHLLIERSVLFAHRFLHKPAFVTTSLFDGKWL